MDLEKNFINLEKFLKLFYKIREIISMINKMDMAFLLGLLDKNMK
jgi:hypothetical protein